ncbi:Multidrug resistance-associated protein 7 [Blomia tropicalis]|nr:Multidrug resistance-associated protein 7 [Blomia tropicalis]
MEPFLVALCNETQLEVLDQSIWKNRTIYYFNDCFQQAFIIAPINVVILTFFAFHLGFYSRYSFSLSGTLNQISTVTVLRFATLLVILALQLSTYLFNFYNLNLIVQVVLVLKLIVITIYSLFLFKSLRIIYFEEKFKILKFSFLIIVVTGLSENFTCFFSSPKINNIFILNVLCSLLWFIHFCFLIKYDNRHQFVAQLLINVDQDDDDHLLHNDENGSYISQTFFGWVSPLLDRGVRSRIDSFNDLFKLPHTLISYSVLDIVDEYLSSSLKRTNFLVRTLFRQFGWKLFIIGIMKLTADVLSFLAPIFLNKILLYLEGDHFNSREGFTYAFGLFGATFLNVILISAFNFQMSKLSLRVRTVLVSIVYHKIFRVRSTLLMSRFDTGQLLNLANTDIERVVNFSPSLYQFISLPIQLVITLYLLYNEVGIIFLSAVFFILALIPLNRIICNKIGTYSQEMMKWKDRRIKMMSEVLRGIRTIKMHFWEQSFINRIQIFRTNEMKYLRWRKYLDALCVYFWATTPVIISSLVFGTFAYVYGSDRLTASKVFTSLALLSMLIMPLNALPWVLNGLIEALVSVRRLEKFFELNETHPQEEWNILERNENKAFELNDCKFDYFNNMDEGNDNFKLGPISLNVSHQSFIAVIGKVGSGKSSLLKSLLNELNRINGTMGIDHSFLHKGIGYVSQESWICDMSVRDNILFGKEFDSERYYQVVDSCALISDFKLFPNADQTIIGNHGATLSGGQKSRIALARAIYQNFDVYILDEPFASVDVKVANEIYEKCLQKLLKGKCLILATNHLEYLKTADSILVFDHGSINQTITFAELNQDLYKTIQAVNLPKPIAETVFDENSIELEAMEEEREVGFVKLNIYLQYIGAIGYFVFSMILASICFMQTSKTTSDFWLSYWTQNKSSGDAMYYLTIFICIAIVNSIVTLIRAFIFAYGGVKAAIVLHDRLLNSVMQTALLFFDLTAFGIIINRFSSDVFNVDDALPFTLNIFLAQLSGLMASLIVTVYGMPWIFILVVPLIIPYYLIQKYFRATSRELKRLSAVSLSPIYSQLDDTIQGLTTIRAFAQVGRFKEDFYHKVDIYNRIQYAINGVQQWLNLRLQLLGVVVTASVAFIAVTLHFYHHDNVNSGLIGLALVYSLSLTSLLNGSVQSFTQTELDMISVERIGQILKSIRDNFDFDNSENEPSLMVDESWPSNGIIRFNNVSMRYRPELDYALKKITLTIEPGEHIVIVGRTGSGKSSLFQVLFRLIKLDSGSISIDGVDISLISVKLLRSKIFIIPQDPFLFSGSIRHNLDPLDEFRDDEIWTALFNCKINILVDSLGGLDAELHENGKDLSVGQRHLFCLARAILNKKKIVCMDEVTANIDPETENVLHELVRTNLKHCTVLHIAHKLESIRNYNRVVVMDSGQIVEICTSQEYLNRYKSVP